MYTKLNIYKVLVYYTIVNTCTISDILVINN